MIRRKARPARRLLSLEPLESRALLTVIAGLTSATVDSLAISSVSANSTAASLFLQFKPTVSPSQESALIRSVGGSSKTTYPDGSSLIQIADGSDLTSVIDQLQSSPLVAYAQPDSTIHSEAAIFPNDPSFPYSWGLNNTNNVDIDAPEAWGLTTGNPSIIVAVLDSGLDLTNPDFSSHLWTNTVNDAAEGYPDDVHGWNFVSNNNDVEDDDGHGTHVTSLIAATGNNGTGIAGVDWNVQIMPVKFLDSNGNGTTDNAVSAIYYAVDHGAKVINASWGGLGDSQALYNAIAYANAHNVVFVTAAGNKGTSNDSTPNYPASFHEPNELSVTSVDTNGLLPSFANYGSQTVDIAAPGVNILGDYPTSLSSTGLQVLSGSSMSTAYVSGVVALLAGVHPEYTAAQLVKQIDASAKPLSSMTGKTISGGMVDAYLALATNPASTSAVTPSGIPALAPGSATDSQIESTILASDEFFAAQGSTAVGFITGLYNDLLNRSPDAGGLAQWVNLYNLAISTRYNIAMAIATSPEGEATQVAEWYQNDLGRTASLAILKTDPGVVGWVQYLSSGLSDEAVEESILASPEYLINHGANPFPVVAGWYQTLMGRSVDVGGLNYWAGLLWAGDSPFSVVQALQNSTEARETRVARWFTNYLGRSQSLVSLKQDSGVAALASELMAT